MALANLDQEAQLELEADLANNLVYKKHGESEKMKEKRRRGK